MQNSEGSLIDKTQAFLDNILKSKVAYLCEICQMLTLQGLAQEKQNWHISESTQIDKVATLKRCLLC